MIQTVFVVFLAAATLECSAFAQSGTLTPVDEAIAQPALSAVRDQALAAVRSRDASGVAALLTPLDPRREEVASIHLSEERSWEVAERALTHGGAFVERDSGERRFCAPWAERALPPRRAAADPSSNDTGLETAVVLEPIDFSIETGAARPSRIEMGYLRVQVDLLHPKAEAMVPRPGGLTLARRASLWTESDSPVCFAWRDGDWRIVEIW
jgi:hypothetical protein